MKVQLVQPTIGDYWPSSRSGCYPPLGLLSIATYIEQECPEIGVEILDGELLTYDEIIARLDADIVGLNANTLTYREAVQIAAIAKGQGARVVLGGVYASAIPDVILRRRGHLFDSLVVGYGEEPMVDIIRGRADRLITNHHPPFDHLPYPDRSLVDLEDYTGVFQRKHPTWTYRGTSIFTTVGCRWRETAGGCVFCYRSGTKAAAKPPEVVWSEVRDLVDRFKIDCLVDFTDTMLQDIDWLRALASSKPRNLDLRWHVFGRVDEVTLEVLDLLKTVGCQHVFLGIESGDPDLYRAAHKGGGSPADSLRVGKLLYDHGFELTPSYILGLPGETHESLARTYEHAQTLKKLTDFEEIFCCPLIPFPGSKAFDLLPTKPVQGRDVYGLEHLMWLWAENFCHLSLCELESRLQDILALGKYRITISKSSPDQHRGLGNADALMIGARAREMTAQGACENLVSP